MDARLGPGQFDAIDHRICSLLHLGGGTQIEHDPLYFRFVRDIRRTQLQRNRIAYLLSDMHRFRAVSGNPGWQRVDAIGPKHRADLVSIQRGGAVFYRLLQQSMRLAGIGG